LSNSQAEIEKLKDNPPGPLIVKTLTENSLSDDFEEARKEWTYDSYIDKESDEYADHCELCNTFLHTGNYVIENGNTKKKMKLGSDCIKRFVLINGVETQADAAKFIDNIDKERGKEFEVIALYKDVISDPVPLARLLNKFIKLMREIIDAKGYEHYTKTESGIKWILRNVLKHAMFDNKEVDRLYKIFNDPGSIQTQKETRRYKQIKKIKEGQMWQKRGKVTATTLSDSGVYHPDI
jgi:hypothetical protein